MTDYTSLYKLIETLYSNYNGKSMLPDWFSVNLKTLLSKNITIEDWNTLQLNVKNVVGESSALYSFCNNLTPVIKELINSTAHSVKFNGNVLYLLDASGKIIDSAILQISYDIELSADSTNAVQNKVIKEALDEKLDKVTDFDSSIRVYGVSPAGSQKAIPASELPHNGNVAMYGTEGQLSSEEPTETYNVATKNYVDKAIENIDLKSDVVDIVHTYADLETYDTSTLTADDIIKVLQDETHSNASSYYRWNTTFEYVGSEGPYYTQTEVDDKVNKKLDKVSSSGDNRVYAVNNNGEQYMIATGTYLGGEGLAGYIPRYDENGFLHSPTIPQNYTGLDYIMPNKQYVDIKVNNKVDKVNKTDSWQVYGVGSKETDLPNKNTINVNEQAIPNTIMNRSKSGTSQINTPINDLDITNKAYVDELTNSKLDKSSSKKTVYATNDDGTTQTNLPYSLLPGESNLAQFDTNGHLYTNDPSIDSHCANKKYVDESLKNYTPLSSYNESLTDIDNIKKVIPNQANENNQLADKDFVNSSINSSAAFFIDNFDTYADLETWQNENPSKATNNDYAYVNSDENHNGESWRYQYVKKDNEVVGIWKPQFKINNTPFTAEQLAAINSGVTKETIDGFSTEMPTDINLDSNNYLILEHDGQEITGQKKQVTIPRFIRDNNFLYTDEEFCLHSPSNTNYTAFQDIGVTVHSGARWCCLSGGVDIAYGPYSYTFMVDNNFNLILNDNLNNITYLFNGKTGNNTLLTDANVKTINGESIYGSGDITINPVYDFTSMDPVFPDYLEESGEVEITDTNIQNKLPNLFNDVKNHKLATVLFKSTRESSYGDTYLTVVMTSADTYINEYLPSDNYTVYGLVNLAHGLSGPLYNVAITWGPRSANTMFYTIQYSRIPTMSDVVPSTNIHKIVYATDDSGKQTKLSYSYKATKNSLAMYDDFRNLYVNYPTSYNHAANKQYVDDEIKKLKNSSSSKQSILLNRYKIRKFDTEEYPPRLTCEAYNNNVPFISTVSGTTSLDTMEQDLTSASVIEVASLPDSLYGISDFTYKIGTSDFADITLSNITYLKIYYMGVVEGTSEDEIEGEYYDIMIQVNADAKITR